MAHELRANGWPSGRQHRSANTVRCLRVARLRCGLHLPDQAVGMRTHDANQRVAAHLWYCDSVWDGEIKRLVLRGAADDLAARLLIAFHHHLHDLANVAGVVGTLNLALALVEDCQARSLLFFADRVLHGNGRSVGARRILEAEDSVELHFLKEGERLLKLR